jgi:hypothetical protein
MEDGHISAESSRSLPEVEGYVLAAEIGAVALAAELAAGYASDTPIVLELDNPQVPRVLLGEFVPPQAERIPAPLLSAAAAFARRDDVALRVLPRNATRGLRYADQLARKRLWRRRRHSRRPML